jgi:tetratricopeptide (TPR) repeat protein
LKVMVGLRLAGLLALSGLTLVQADVAASETRMGTISFPNSGKAEAQESFIRGVLALHNFWFDEAEEAFEKAEEIDPGFALAYWGEAMSHNHPLWSQQDMPAARAALQKLGATRAERSAKARTEREKAYLEAVEVLYGEGDKLERDRAYSKLMGRMVERFSNDDEAKVLYALSLLGTVRPGDKGFARQMKSAAILADVQQRNPMHPGAAHFTIHSFDDPEHAPLGLRAADVYAQIAPEAPHALHMPTHIYVQLGMWDRVLASNEAAYAASVKWVERKGLSHTKRDFHSLEWREYGALQLGQYDKARDLVPLAEEVAAQTGDGRTQVYAASMRARYLLESRRYEDLPLPELPTAPVTGARAHGVYGTLNNQLAVAGLSAAHLGQYDKAEEAARRLRSVAQMRKDGGTSAYDVQPIEITAVEIEGLARFLKGDTQGGLERLLAATQLEEAMDPPSGPPSPIKPAPELYGEALLQAGKGREAQKAFETSLQRMPRRSLSLLGLARAAVASGDEETAAEAYGQLATFWAAADPSRERDEVRGSSHSQSRTRP